MAGDSPQLIVVQPKTLQCCGGLIRVLDAFFNLQYFLVCNGFTGAEPNHTLSICISVGWVSWCFSRVILVISK